MNIVIVDDDRLVAQSLKIILENTGNVHVLAFGENGEEAIELYKIYKPDIILMDIRMPGISGLEAAESILDFDKNARILFLTTFPDDDYIVKSLQIGAKGYILNRILKALLLPLKQLLKVKAFLEKKSFQSFLFLWKKPQNLIINHTG